MKTISRSEKPRFISQRDLNNLDYDPTGGKIEKYLRYCMKSGDFIGFLTQTDTNHCFEGARVIGAVTENLENGQVKSKFQLTIDGNTVFFDYLDKIETIQILHSQWEKCCLINHE